MMKPLFYYLLNKKPLILKRVNTKTMSEIFLFEQGFMAKSRSSSGVTLIFDDEFYSVTDND